jgi:hypothetical protein
MQNNETVQINVGDVVIFWFDSVWLTTGTVKSINWSENTVVVARRAYSGEYPETIDMSRIKCVNGRYR